MSAPPRHHATLLTAPGLAHGFFGRPGGVSAGLFASLNCGLGSEDDRDAVLTNRRQVAESFALNPAQLVTPHQIHSTTVVTVETPWAPGAGPECDALVTKVPGLLLGVLSADCAPLLFADLSAGVIGAAHAGWKGALTGVAEATISAMEALGAARAQIIAAIGPCIAQTSYEVGPEFEARFIEQDGPQAGRFFARPTPAARPHFDLPAYLADRLVRAGLTGVETLGLDTVADEEGFFSYRRGCLRGEKRYGRDISVITLT